MHAVLPNVRRDTQQYPQQPVCATPSSHSTNHASRKQPTTVAWFMMMLTTPAGKQAAGCRMPRCSKRLSDPTKPTTNNKLTTAVSNTGKRIRLDNEVSSECFIDRSNERSDTALTTHVINHHPSRQATNSRRLVQARRTHCLTHSPTRTTRISQLVVVSENNQNVFYIH